ncbi:MAG: DUF58 domain-containing protein [Ktedonobacteraceae bacterium]
MNKKWYYACAGIVLLALLLLQPLLLLVGLLGLLVLITADIWGKYCLDNLLFQREMSEKRVLFGEEITLAIAIENSKLLPLPWLEVEDIVPSGLSIQGRQLRVNSTSNRAVLENLFSPRWYERVTRHYAVTCNSRGVHTFGPTQMRSGDLFGFTDRQETFENKQYLIVYPLIVPLSSFNLPARYPFGDRRAPRRLLEDPSRVIGVRDYSYGDDLRRVHWKATARSMQLQSKVYEATTTYTLVLFLNVATQLDTHFGVHPELQELAICAAASVTDWALNEGYSVGLYANSMMYMPELGMKLPERWDQDEHEQEASLANALADMRKRRRIHVPPASNAEQRKRIMETLARIQGYFGTSIETLIQSERSHVPVGTTIVIITSTINDPLLDELAHLKQVGHAVTILLVGDQPMAARLAGITVYHLGGEDAWHKMIASYTIPEGTDGSKGPGQQAVGLRL